VSQPLYRRPSVIRFQDVDAAGIIFFARAYDYMHDAFVECLKTRGLDLAQHLAKGTWGAPLVHSEADYKKPLRFGTEIFVEIDRAEFGETSVAISYTLRGVARGEVFCTGRLVHAFIDRTSFRPCPVPAEMRAVFASPAAEESPA
jgi:YbgC/YbaW family acyl-CoA thioester hydrolase